MKLETLAIHAARSPDASTGALAAPIVLSSTFERDADGGYPRGHSYSREGNPGRLGLERAIAALEGGTAAVAFASGSAAAAAVFAIPKPGELVLIGEQDPSRWDTAEIAQGRGELGRALALGGRGPYVLQAAVASLHAEQPCDWRQIATLYAELGRLTASPVVELNRATIQTRNILWDALSKA